jgi:hypothetical protein
MDTIEFVSLPNAPTIPGLRFRRWHDIGDYQQMTAVREGSRAWDRVDVLSAREESCLMEHFCVALAESCVKRCVKRILLHFGSQFSLFVGKDLTAGVL